MGDLKIAFDKFAKTKVQSGLTSKEATDWFKAANLLAKPGKGKFTSNDLDIQYSSAKGKDLGLSFAKLDVLLNKVKVSYAKDVKKSEDEAIQMMTDALAKAEPTKTGTGTSKTGGVDRMTDASKYTGAHKQRFDAEGKGKGKAGREEQVENTGYVGNYKGKDTFDKKH